MTRSAIKAVVAGILAASCGEDATTPAAQQAPRASPQAQAPAPTNLPSTDAGHASASATEPASAQAALGTLPAPLGELREANYADKYARRDSKLDGWDTEFFNERAGKQLGDLGKLIAHPETLDEAHLAALLDTEFECVDLRPPVELAAKSQGALSSARNDAPPSELAHHGWSGARDALAELAQWFEGASDTVAKFKIIAVEPRDGVVVTRQYLQAKGRPKAGARQINATWVCTWSALPPERTDALPKLKRIELEAHAETNGPAGGAPLFTEVTDAVFASAESFEEQLRPTLEHWSARIDKTLGMSLIGHEGIALGDVDGDLLDDVYVCQPGGLPNRLYVRQQDGTVRDTSAAAGVDFLDGSRSALIADFDKDGDQDLAVELDPLVLLLANDGQGHFTLRAKAEAPSTTSLSAVDFDSDGDLDLYCCGYVLPDTAEFTPLPYHDANNGRPNTLLRNESTADGWRFVDATREVGLDQNNRRFSFSAAWEDYDEDGDLDCYVANDFGRNNLYRNDGGKFVDVADQAGVEDMAAGMGVTWADYDLDGDLDLHVSNMFSSAGERVTYQRQFKPGIGSQAREDFQRHARGNSLFQNLGDGTFRDVSLESGITMGRWAWGSIFTDFDDDGRADLFVPNGFVTGEDPEDL
ncbi:MAG: VCBS repeat-containing protein [Planctomycetes bacterium]|nr:VCBS repeat-containing protein [Planctomycetota bacterium]